jgi:hypothetical protein
MKSLFASIAMAAVVLPGAAIAADEMKKCCCCEEMKKADCCDERSANKKDEHAGHGEHTGHEAPAAEKPAQ